MKCTPTENYFPNQRVSEEKGERVQMGSLRIFGIHRRKDKAVDGNQRGAQLKRSRRAVFSGTRRHGKCLPFCFTIEISFSNPSMARDTVSYSKYFNFDTYSLLLLH
jgi:hypothetical protein